MTSIIVIRPRESVENGVTGFLVPAKSADAVYEALLKLIDDPIRRRTMGEKGRQRVIRKFDRKAFIDAVVQHRLKLLS